MQDIIKPIDRALLKAELTGDKKLRRTNKSNNEIYIITAHDSPNVMQEIGRLREIAFRYYGGGTGFPVDIDEYDTMDDAYRQLIVWSPEDEQILGGYRFLCGSDVKFDKAGKPVLATSHLFNFSDKFNPLSFGYAIIECQRIGEIIIRPNCQSIITFIAFQSDFARGNLNFLREIISIIITGIILISRRLSENCGFDFPMIRNFPQISPIGSINSFFYIKRQTGNIFYFKSQRI